MPSPLRIDCAHATDHVVAASVARRFAEESGFDPHAASAVAIAVGELVSNAVRHAGFGTLELQPLLPPRPGVQIRVVDRGPGIPAQMLSTVERWQKSTPRPESVLSATDHGLAAVVRLVDTLLIRSSTEGTHIEAICLIKPSPSDRWRFK